MSTDFGFTPMKLCEFLIETSKVLNAEKHPSNSKIIGVESDIDRMR
jgi:hypothetical protein